ncbi:MAG: hypothetical protein ACOC3J_07370 [Gemmatimonadota bacterium]
MLTRAIITAVLGLTLGTTGCFFARQDDDRKPDLAESDSVHVLVVNEHYYDARVHAVYAGGHRHALGTIAGNGGTTEATLNWEPHPLVFQIGFIISGHNYVTEPVDLVRGEHIELRLPPNIEMSGHFRRVSGR